MIIKTIDIGFAILSIELVDDKTPDELMGDNAPETTLVVVGLTDKKTKAYIQDLCLVQKADEKEAVNVYVYADENSEDCTDKFEINKYEEGKNDN